MKLTEKIAAMGLIVPEMAGAFGMYVPAKLCGNIVIVSGQMPMKNGRLVAIGQVPSRCSIEQARDGAKQCVINALAAAKTAVDLNHLIGVARVGVFVNSDATFTEQPSVANAASELLIEIFGEAGRHARAAVGVAALPLDAAVEIEIIFQCRVDEHE